MLNTLIKVSLLVILIIPAAIMPLWADTSSEKTELRKLLLDDVQSTETRIRLGIILAGDVADSANMDFTSEAESALRMLNYEVISSLSDINLKKLAWLAKAAVYKRLLMPAEAQKYIRLSGGTFCHELNPSFSTDIKMPYYIDLGIKFEDTESILTPYMGIGLTKSAFSSILAGTAGVKYFRDCLRFKLNWTQAVIPDFSCMDIAWLNPTSREAPLIFFQGRY